MTDATKQDAIRAMDVVKFVLASIWASALIGAALSAATWTRLHLDELLAVMKG